MHIIRFKKTRFFLYFLLKFANVLHICGFNADPLLQYESNSKNIILLIRNE